MIFLFDKKAAIEAAPRRLRAQRQSSPPLEWAMIFTLPQPVDSTISRMRAVSSAALSATEAADWWLP